MGLYSSWIASAEHTVAGHHGVQAPAGPRRADGVQFSLRPARVAAKTRVTPLRNQISCWWTQVHALVHGIHHHRKRQNGVCQVPRYVSTVRRHVDVRPEQAHRVLLADKDRTRDEWINFLVRVEEATGSTLDRFALAAKKVGARGQRQALQESLTDFHGFVEDPASPGRLHVSLNPPFHSLRWTWKEKESLSSTRATSWMRRHSSGAISGPRPSRWRRMHVEHYTKCREQRRTSRRQASQLTRFAER